MKRLITIILLLAAMLYTVPASAEYLTLHDERVELRKPGWVVFPITNETGGSIDAIYGAVYRYKDEKPYKFTPVSNRHIAAVKLSVGRHKSGETVLYAFKLPIYKMKLEKYGLVVYDAPIRFSK